MKKKTQKTRSIFSQWRISYTVFTILAVSLVIVGVFVLARLFFVRNAKTVYVRVKLSPGAWWSRGVRPGMWYVSKLKEEEVQKDIVGNEKARLLNIEYYPWLFTQGFSSDEYDVYIVARIIVKYNKSDNVHIFNDTVLSVGSPIVLEFPSTLVTGTVVDFSERMFKDAGVDKTVLIAKYAYPWEYDAISIGDKLINNKKTIVEVVDKWRQEESFTVVFDRGLIDGSMQEVRGLIYVKLRMRLKKTGNVLFLGEDQAMRKGKLFSFALPNFLFDDYRVVDIQ